MTQPIAANPFCLSTGKQPLDLVLCIDLMTSNYLARWNCLTGSHAPPILKHVVKDRNLSLMSSMCGPVCHHMDGVGCSECSEGRVLEIHGEKLLAPITNRALLHPSMAVLLFHFSQFGQADTIFHCLLHKLPNLGNMDPGRAFLCGRCWALPLPVRVMSQCQCHN